MNSQNDDNRSARAKVIAATEGESTPVVSQTKRGTVSDFFYHRRLLLAAVIFVLILAAFSLGSFFLRGGKSDVTVLYGGPVTLYADSGIDHALRSVRTGEGAENVSLSDVVWLDSEDIAALNGEYTVDEAANARELARFREEMTHGDAVFLMLSPTLYGEVRESLLPLSEVFGELPPSAADEYSIRLGDTDFYKFFTAVQALPEDTRLCLRRAEKLDSLSESRAQRLDSVCRQLLRDVVGFVSPLGSE